MLTRRSSSPARKYLPRLLPSTLVDPPGSCASSRYKKKLVEMRKWEAEQAKREAMEKDVNTSGMGGFYRNLLKNKERKEQEAAYSSSYETVSESEDEEQKKSWNENKGGLLVRRKKQPPKKRKVGPSIVLCGRKLAPN